LSLGDVFSLIILAGEFLEIWLLDKYCPSLSHKSKVNKQNCKVCNSENNKKCPYGQSTNPSDNTRNKYGNE